MNIKLCGRPGCGGCPTVIVRKDGSAIINNDEGMLKQKMEMTKRSWNELKKCIKAGEFD